MAQRNGVSEQEIETMLKEWGKELSGQKPSGLKRLGIDEIALVKGQKNYCVVLVDIDKKIIVGWGGNKEVETLTQKGGELGYRKKYESAIVTSKPTNQKNTNAILSRASRKAIGSRPVPDVAASN